MKAILFTQEDTTEFDELQERIHLHLETKNGVNGFIYSAECWANVESALIYENQLCLKIDEYKPRYDYILEILTEEEKESIVDIELNT